MESRKQRHIPLACRFVPYDQWFLTHIEPNWKIKHIKQMILGKCFGLPFDRRKFIRDNSAARPPSPITFAPDDAARPISPIQFATVQEVRKKRSVGPEDGDDLPSTAKPSSSVSVDRAVEEEGEAGPGDEGYEEDDEWDEEDETSTSSPRMSFVRPTGGGRVDVGGKVEMATPTTTSTGSPVGEKPARKFNPLSKLTGSSNTNNNTGSSSNHTSSHTSSNNTTSIVSQGSIDFVVVAQPQQEKKMEMEIQTHDYTLIRFSTGQVLEDDFVAAWYDLLPNELVELHLSSTPASFQAARHFPEILMDPTYRSATTTTTTLTNNSNNNNNFSTKLRLHSASDTFLSTGITLTALPRNDPIAYAQPYWEGWVRALRQVYSSEMPVGALGMSMGMGMGHNTHTSFQEYGAGMTNLNNSMAGGLAFFMADPGLFPDKDKDKYHRGIEGSELKKKLEWRDRWVVVRDGNVSLCKTRYDLTPTHTLPLTALVALRDASHLNQNPTHHKSKFSSSTTSSGRQRSKTLRSGESERDYHHRGHRRSISQPRSTTSTVKEHRHRDDGRHTKTQPGSTSSRDYPKADPSSRRTDKPSSSKQHSGSHSTSAPAAGEGSSSHHYHHQRRGDDDVDVDREREKQRQRAREREVARQKERERRYREEKELEYLKNWDNISFKRKPKDKDKDKDKDKVDKGKGREMDGSYPNPGEEHLHLHQHHHLHKPKRPDVERPPNAHSHSHSHSQWIDKDGEEERDPASERARQRQRRERERLIPRSREEAENAGMKIVCAKFKDLRGSERERERERERQKKKNAATQGPRYTSTGPSLASEAAAVAGTNDSDVTEKDRKDVVVVGNAAKTPGGDDFSAHQSQTTAPSLLQTVAPRKTSLPVLHLPSTKASSHSLTLNSPYTGPNALALAAGGSGSSAKFGIGGFFGKDRNPSGDREMPSDDPNTAKREKEERKREEKERKAREKEQKVLEKRAKEKEKEKEKAKRREETADEEESMTGTGTGSGLGWKLGKKRSGKVKDDALVDSGPFSDSAVPSSYRREPLSIDTARGPAQPQPPIAIIVGGHEENVSPFDDPTTPATRVRPRLTLSPIPGSATQRRSGSNSSSCSLSSPVFHHSSDSERSVNDFNTDVHGAAPSSTRRAERKGYRYGGYHDMKQEENRRKPKASDAGKGPRKPVIGLFDPPEEPPKPPEKEEAGKGKGKGKEPQKSGNSSKVSLQVPEFQSNARDRDRDRGEGKERRERDEEHGEWIVLDLGTDSAFNSFLRIFHRYLSEPLTSDFIPASMVAAISIPGYDPASLTIDSNLSSPVHSHFSSSTTLVKGTDHGSNTLASSSTLRLEHDLDDANISHHPTTLQASSKISKNPSSAPALPYPEWRRELVLRARRHGLRDGCRPLDLALHGWSRDFEEMDFLDMASRIQEEKRSQVPGGYFGADLYGYDEQVHSDDMAGESDDDWVHGVDKTEDDDDDDDAEELEDVRVAGLRGDEGRRMSQISHVSTIRASDMNTAAAAAASVRSSSQSVVEALDENDEGDQRPEEEEEEEEMWEESESVMGYKDDEYEPSSEHGRDVDEDPNVLDMDSMLDDSDEEGESESEWAAWMTDLPRQIEVRRMEKELEGKRREEEEERQRQEALRKEGYKPGEKPLSPMVFSNPFSDQQPVPPLDVDYLDLDPTHAVPQTQEQERRQNLARRRKLEPTTEITTMLSSRAVSLAESQSVISIASVLGPIIPAQAQVQPRGQQSHPTRMTNRTATTLSSHSSSESLGQLTQPTFNRSPFQTDAEREHDNASSSTIDSPASPSAGAGNFAHHHTYSGSISGSESGHPRLHHSLSMPLGHGSALPLVRGHGGNSVPSSVPHSPTIPGPPTPNKSIMKKPAQPVSMTILTQTQINEIESETSQRIHHPYQHQHPTGGFQPTAMSSPSSSFVPKSVPIPMPRRSSSAGFSGSSSPPSGVGVGPVNMSTSLGSVGSATSAMGGSGGTASLSRSASLLVKPQYPAAAGLMNERAERERGVLKKKPSDIAAKGKEREVDVSPSVMNSSSKQRPKLSLSTMSPASSSPSSSIAMTTTSSQYTNQQPEVHSPTMGSSKMSSAKAFLRRVRSGSSLRLDSHMEEDDDDDDRIPLSPTTREGREMSPPPTRRKISTMDRFVRGLDSALEFVEGR